MLTTLIPTVLAVAGHVVARTPAARPLGEVYFAFDSSALSDTSRAKLQEPAAFALANPSTRLVLDAHTDPIGTAAYNIGLSMRRATSVRSALIDMGVPKNQIVLAFYGEDGAARATYAEDRRVTVWHSKASVDAVIAYTFAGGGTAVTWARPMTMDQMAETPTAVAISKR